jgi:hypothetical protein
VLYTRRHPRFRLSEAQLNGQMTFASQVSILDVGLGGVSVKADKRLNIGGTYMLKLEGAQQSLSVRCEVAWARMSGTRRADDGGSVAVYTAGMKFVDLSADHAATLQNLIDALGTDPIPNSGDRRTHPRFPSQPPGLALLDFPSDYSVTTISLGGMLIRCSTVIEPESIIPMRLALQGGDEIGFEGRVVSCQPAFVGTTEAYYAGIEFVGLTEDGRALLAAFIAELDQANG